MFYQYIVWENTFYSNRTHSIQGLLSGSAASMFYQYIVWETYRYDPVAYAAGNPSRAPGIYRMCSLLLQNVFSYISI